MTLVLAYCALGLAGVALAFALGGLGARLSKYVFSVAVVVFGIPALLFALAELAMLFAREPRRGSFWDRQGNLLVADGLLVERLGARAPSDLKLVHALLSSQQNALRERQQFVLGSAAALSPFVVMLLLVALPIGAESDMLVQYFPWTRSFASQPLVWFEMFALGWCFVIVRLYAKSLDEHFEACRTLLQCALDRNGS